MTTICRRGAGRGARSPVSRRRVLSPLAAVLLWLAWGSIAAAAVTAKAPATFITYHAAAGETLMDIARRFDLGFVELRAANPGVDAWQPGVGRKIVVPTLHLQPQANPKGIVVNLAEMRLYLYRGAGAPAISFPIGIGRSGWDTPVGVTRVVRKRANPTWVPPASIRAAEPNLPAAVPPGPANPLGAYALSLSWPGYVIHGTNKPDGVGRRVSHGCMRLYPEDIERLFGMVSLDTQVTVVNQPVKLEWIGKNLYLEIHPSLKQALRIEESGHSTPETLPHLRAMITSYVGAKAADIDWQRVEQAARERRGLAVRISR